MSGWGRSVGRGVLAFGVIAYAGCGSVGYKAQQGQAAVVPLVSLQGKLYVRSIDTQSSNLSSGGAIYQPEIAAVLSALTPERINKVLMANYPQTFSERGTLPLNLSIDFQYNNNFSGRMTGAFFTGLTFGLMPFHITSEYTFSIKVDEGKGPVKDVYPKSARAVGVERKGWGSIIPTGYLPCPYSLDTPRETITGPMEIEVSVSEPAKAFIAQQVASCIAKIVSETDPENIKRAATLQSLMND